MVYRRAKMPLYAIYGMQPGLENSFFLLAVQGAFSLFGNPSRVAVANVCHS